ncbi:hypothetical protein [Gordonia amicalis]|uniref:Uncharacterized protein n=1 Tax=Gordonia amicalis TaxID=89053 RepID=A0ABU4DJH9_9ACTN|nr:hypothetical protein [Gordonia amicalis]MDV6309921.1 hypothetical protein [Gordonia amicalis]
MADFVDAVAGLIDRTLCVIGLHRIDEHVVYDVNDSAITIEKCDSCGKLSKVY